VGEAMPNPVKLRANVAAVDSFGDGIHRVRFVPCTPAPRFKAGQFLHLTVDDYDSAGGFWPESRVFSIASPPGTDHIDIIYSVKGRYTRRMEDRLAVGVDVWLKLPYGEFIVERGLLPKQDVVLVAGGTGISPFLPYLENLLRSHTCERRVRVYYGVRNRRLALAAGLLSSCAVSGLADARLFVESEERGDTSSLGLPCEKGKLNVNRIAAESSDLDRPVFFLSGPPEMIRAFREGLTSAGFAAGAIKIDEWE
jgi:ferredoxin-NADP reductase